MRQTGLFISSASLWSLPVLLLFGSSPVFILTPIQALVSVLLLDGIYIYNTGAFEFNPNIVMLATWAFTILFFYQALTKDQWSIWISTGVIAGLARDTKYKSILLHALLFLFLLINPIRRQTLVTSKPYISSVIAFLVFIPNLIWLIQYHFAPMNYVSDELTSQAPFLSLYLILIASIPIGYAIYMQKLTTAYSNLFPGPTFAQHLEKI